MENVQNKFCKNNFPCNHIRDHFFNLFAVQKLLFFSRFSEKNQNSEKISQKYNRFRRQILLNDFGIFPGRFNTLDFLEKSYVCFAVVLCLNLTFLGIH